METKPTDYRKTANLLIIIFLSLYGVILLKSILIPLFFAALFATLLVPVTNLFEKWGVKRILSTILTLIFAIIVLGGIVYLIQWQLSGFVEELPELGDKLTEKLTELQLAINEKTPFKINLETNRLKQSAITFAQDNSRSLTKIIFSLLGGATVFLLIPVYIFLFLLYRDFLQEFVIRLFEKSDKQYISGMTEKINKVSQSYISGVFIVAIILSVINTIVLTIFGIKHAIFFAVLAGFLNAVPYIGPMVAALLPIVFAWLTKDSVWYPLGIFIGLYTVQMFEGYYLTPRIVGNNVNINPLIVIIALISGYLIWGVVGMILIIPIVAILKIIFDEIDSLKPIGFLIGAVQNDSEKTSFFDKIKILKQRIFRK